MSKKESYLLTKEYSYQGSKKSFSSKSSKNEQWASLKNEGTIKCDLYPSVVMLKRDLKGFSQTDLANEDFGNLFENRGSDGINCVNAAFTKLYNEQGHYSVEQSICNLLCIPLLCGQIHTNEEPCAIRNLKIVTQAINILIWSALTIIVVMVIFWATSKGLDQSDVAFGLLALV